MPELTDDDFKPRRVEPQIPLGKPRRGGHRAGLLIDPHVSKEQIASAVTYMTEANAGATALTAQMEQVAIAATALLSSRLTDDALATLLQPQLPKSTKGHPFPKKDIILVLQAAARLAEVNLKPAIASAKK